MPSLRTRKKFRCPTCDHRNPVDAKRCEICTRMLQNDLGPSGALAEETLFSEPVSTRHIPKKRSNFALGLFCIGAFAGLFVANYAITNSFIPHPVRSYFEAKDANWKTYAGNPAFLAVMPGDPVANTRQSPVGEMNVASVWIDSNWDVVRDANTFSPGQERDALAELHASLAVATAPSNGNAAPMAADTLAAMRPDATVSDATVGKVVIEDGVSYFDVTASYANWPDASGEGTVMARFSERDGTLLVIATYLAGDDDPDLQKTFIDNVEFTVD